MSKTPRIPPTKASKMTEEKIEDANNEGSTIEGSTEARATLSPPVAVGPHPLGGVAVRVRAADGTEAQARIELEDASVLAAHLNALLTMFFQAAYGAAAKQAEAMSKIHVPGG